LFAIAVKYGVTAHFHWDAVESATGFLTAWLFLTGTDQAIQNFLRYACSEHERSRYTRTPPTQVSRSRGGGRKRSGCGVWCDIDRFRRKP
jgi:hypothetical protein